MKRLIFIIAIMSLSVNALEPDQRTSPRTQKKTSARKKNSLISKQIQLIKVIAKRRVNKDSQTSSAN